MQDFKQQLYVQLKETGMVSSLRSQLRALMVEQLQRDNPRLVKQPSPDRGTVWHQAMNSIIVDYLSSCKLDFTLSVFLKESGVTPTRGMSQAELLQLLGIRPGSQVYENLQADLQATENQPCFATALLKAVQHMAHANNEPHGSGPAGVPMLAAPGSMGTPSTALALRQPNSATSAAVDRPSSSAVLENYMLQYRQECDELLQQEVARRLEHFRDIELNAVRLEESTKYRRLVETEREELQRLHQQHLHALRRKEEEVADSLRAQQRDLESAAHVARQHLLKEEQRLKDVKAQVDWGLNNAKDAMARLTDELNARQRAVTAREEAAEERIAAAKAAAEEAPHKVSGNSKK